MFIFIYYLFNLFIINKNIIISYNFVTFRQKILAEISIKWFGNPKDSFGNPLALYWKCNKIIIRIIKCQLNKNLC